MSSGKFLTPEDAPDGTVEITITVPSGEEWEALARGALALLVDDANFEQSSGTAETVEDSAYYFLLAISKTFEDW